MSEPTQDDFDCIKSVALSSMETAEALMDECVKRADRIKELEAHVYSVTEQRDRFARVNTRLMRKADEQYYTLCEHVAYTYQTESERDSTILHLTKEHNNDIKELEAELERRACVVKDQLHVMKEMRDELLEDWEKKRGDVARLKTIVHELEADTVCFKSAVNVFRALVDNKDLRIADLESQRGMVRKTRDAREEELLGIIDDLTTKNQLIECQNNHMSEKLRNAPNDATWYSQADVDGMRRMFDRRCEEIASDDMSDRKLLGNILHIVNPLIKSGAYAKPSAESRLLSIQMHELCQTVVQFRSKHDIVG